MYPPTYSLSQGFVNQFPKDYDGADMYMYSNTVVESVENSHLNLKLSTRGLLQYVTSNCRDCGATLKVEV